ncbi:hypothetical protein G4B88_000627, partial [Cannabis sativa]
MEVVNTLCPLNKGKSFSCIEAYVTLSPSTSSLKALSTLCLYGKVVAPMVVDADAISEFVTNRWQKKIYNLPHEYFSVAKGMLLGATIGKVCKVDLEEDKPVAWKLFLRVQVDIDIGNPLVSGCFFDLASGVKKWLQFKYEKIGIFCYFCGRLGHQRRGCSLSTPVTVANLDDIPFPMYGPWMSTASRYHDVFSSEVMKPLAVVASEAPTTTIDCAGPSANHRAGGARLEMLGSRREMIKTGRGFLEWVDMNLKIGERSPDNLPRIEPLTLEKMVSNPLGNSSSNKEVVPLKSVPPFAEKDLSFVQGYGPYKRMGKKVSRKVDKNSFSGPFLVGRDCVAPRFGSSLGSKGTVASSGSAARGLTGLCHEKILNNGMESPFDEEGPTMPSSMQPVGDKTPKAHFLLGQGGNERTCSQNGLDQKEVDGHELILVGSGLGNGLTNEDSHLNSAKESLALDLYEIKSLGGDIGVLTTSETNERTTPFKKRKFEGSASLCTRPHKTIRTHPDVVRDFPWDSEEKDRESKVIYDDPSEEASDSVSCNEGIMKNPLNGSFVVEDSG